jgi:hypothetical protein
MGRKPINLFVILILVSSAAAICLKTTLSLWDSLQFGAKGGRSSL